MNARDDDRDRADWGADPELLDVLCSADPAHSLPPSHPEHLARLVEAVLAADGPSRRRPLVPWVVAAALVVLAGLSGVTLLTRDPVPSSPTAVAPAPDDTDPAGSANPSGSATPAGRTTVLEVPATGQARCAVPTAEVLGGQQVAFEGTVVSVADGTAVLDTTTVFAGDVADQVEVRAPSQQMGELLSAVQFEPGRSYLVSGTDGQVALCGYSALDSASLRTLYQQAFAG